MIRIRDISIKGGDKEKPNHVMPRILENKIYKQGEKVLTDVHHQITG